MKILHIVENYSFTSGGIRTVVKNLHYELITLKYSSNILSCQKDKEDNISIVNASKKPWLKSKDWDLKLAEIHSETQIDCIHIHGAWMYPQYIAAKFSINNNIPFVLSPHGMYEPWLWTKGTLKKKIYFHFLVKNLFSKASVIHAITQQEKENLQKLFPKTNITEIPNLIKEEKNQYKEPVFKEKYFFFIGRLDSKKGIELLINTFIKINPKGFKLKIAGKNNNYTDKLKQIIEKNNFDKSKIKFLGFVEGEDKKILIKNAFVLVAPSYSEVIGMVNLEGAILKTPVITTFQTGLKEPWNDNGGFLINPKEDELEKILREVLTWSKDKRDAEGNKLYNYVKENYSWATKIKDWQKLYKSALQ